MKHLKTFENEENYQVGDYISIKAFYFRDKEPIFGKIINDCSDEDKVPLDVLTASGKDLWITKKMIDRKLDKYEIEQFDIELSANIYNL